MENSATKRVTRCGQTIGVVGTGYVGLTLGTCMAHLGHNVVCVDVDMAKVEALRRGFIPMVEDGLQELVVEGLADQSLRFELNTPAMLAECDVIFLCLPTPVKPNGGLDLSYIDTAVRSIRADLKHGAVVVTKSTVPIGTFGHVQELLGRPDVAVVSNPEFLREGTAVADFLTPDRIVIGGTDGDAVRQVADLYRGIDAPVVTTDPTSAELIKYAANSFLATKISLVNEISRLCDRVGGDIQAVRDGLGSDPRIGATFLAPGPGWGGSCFPKDTRGLVHLAHEVGLELPVIDSAILSNNLQFDDVFTTVAGLIDRRFTTSRIAVWGATFKAGTDDCRDSPAMILIDRLVEVGCDVVVYDPAAAFDHPGVDRCSDPYSACLDADALVVMTEWPEFAQADLDKVSLLLAHPVVCDTRHIIDRELAAKSGLHLVQPGRAAVLGACSGYAPSGHPARMLSEASFIARREANHYGPNEPVTEIS